MLDDEARAAEWVPRLQGASKRRPRLRLPALAVQLKTLIDIDWLHSAYALRLAANGSCCEWVIRDSDGLLGMTLEPDSR